MYDRLRAELNEQAYRERTAHEADILRRIQQARAERDRQRLPPSPSPAADMPPAPPPEPKVIPLRFYAHGINFGRIVESGKLTETDLVIPVKQIQHTLVGGVPGSGKTVWLHAVIAQLLRSNEVHRLVLIDLKAGVEFEMYAGHPKARVCSDIERVAEVFEQLVSMLHDRLQMMRGGKLRTWPGERVFVIVDEYAMLHGFIGEAKAKGQKELAARLANDLRELVLMARAAGIVLICALQKPTSDAIDSNLKANMGFRACFRVKTRQATEAVLEASSDDLPIDPRDLRVGRFVFDDGRAYERVQAPIAPGLDLSGGW
ncbi:FtsK/SpoIIIE domain-containing protein [Bradyrhizobium sp. HKCCYLRH1073]|uniref:FtsK/SpoIIIE domain-containing protein n=1 Tax=unclassified Bradyrhizobium TaxID=2631580 RepID=UPI003EB98123